ncbi:MAG TPA: alpha/beta fold hydrolase [Verrucomicrobiales bacterium]|nr:alpha/beta fold hydrolase [Verrucomicrobiales bacterium]
METMFGDLTNQEGEKIDSAYSPPADPQDPRIVVLGHGVTGNKDRPLLVAVADALRAHGLATLRISFAGNGESHGRFEDCTVTKETSDLSSVLDALGDRPIAYVGHSMGAAVGVLCAAANPRIRVLVSLAGMVHTAQFAEREFGAEIPGSGSMWDDPSCPLSAAFMEDMRKAGSVLPFGARVSVPWLLVHGADDDVVPIADSEDIAPTAGGPHRFVRVPGADHSFTGQLEIVSTEVADWITNRLN